MCSRRNSFERSMILKKFVILFSSLQNDFTLCHSFTLRNELILPYCLGLPRPPAPPFPHRPRLRLVPSIGRGIESMTQTSVGSTDRVWTKRRGVKNPDTPFTRTSVVGRTDSLTIQDPKPTRLRQISVGLLRLSCKRIRLVRYG